MCDHVNELARLSVRVGLLERRMAAAEKRPAFTQHHVELEQDLRSNHRPTVPLITIIRLFVKSWPEPFTLMECMMELQGRGLLSAYKAPKQSVYGCLRQMREAGEVTRSARVYKRVDPQVGEGA